MRSLKMSMLVLVVLVVGIVCADDAWVLASPAPDLHQSPFDTNFSGLMDTNSPVTDTFELNFPIFLPLICSPAPQTVRWNFAAVDREYTTVDDGAFSSDMVLDSDGSPHIAYDVFSENHFNVLRYAHLTGSQWVTEEIGSTDLGAEVSLALSSDDVPHISYSVCNPWYCAPRYAEQIGAGWVITDEIDGRGTVAIDSEGNPHLSYSHGNQVGQITLRYAHRLEGNWITTTIAGPADDYRSPTLEWDTSGFAHMTYNEYVQSSDPYTNFYIGGSLRYARWDGSAWIVDVLDDDIVDETAHSRQIGQNSALALGANDSIHIGYYDWDEYGLKYVLWSGSDWVTETVDTVHPTSSWSVQYVALALDTDDQPHLVYFDQGTVKYAHRTEGQWMVETLDTDVGQYSDLSVAVDAQNRIHVTYNKYDGQGTALMYGWSEL